MASVIMIRVVVFDTISMSGFALYTLFVELARLVAYAFVSSWSWFHLLNEKCFSCLMRLTMYTVDSVYELMQ